MRFDLEIPQFNIDVCFIKNGDSIPNVAVPTYYIKINSSDKIPSDYVTYDNYYSEEDHLYNGYEIKNGPYLDNIKSSKFLITNIAKFSLVRNTKMPLFYRHFIPVIIKQEGIIIEDYYGTIVPSEDYLIDYSDNGTYVYMNKTSKVLFIKYALNNSSRKELLNLLPVFEEAEWSDIQANQILKPNKYIYREGAIDTSYNGELYITYLSNTGLFRPPLGNIDDPWYIGILNCELTIDDNIYKIPEYYFQQMNADGKYKFVEFKKCKKIYNRYVKSQYNIHDKYYDDIYLYIKDGNTNKVKYAFSYNKSKIGTIYKDNIVYGELKFYNNDGVIESPVEILDTDEVFASHYTRENYYEYNLLDIKSLNLNSFNYYAIYIKPNVTEGRSVFHAIIGDRKDEDDQNLYFNSFDEYKAYIDNEDRKYYHVGIFNTLFKKDDIALLSVLDQDTVMLSKEEIANINVDMLYYDVLNNKINIPANDAVIVSMDTSKLQDKGIIQQDNNGVIDNSSKDYIRILEGYTTRTLQVSTKSIYEIIKD